MLYKGLELEEYSGGFTRKLVDLVGQTFGSWKVLCRAPNDKSKNTRFWCECTCGKLMKVGSGALIYGLSTQCRKCSVQKYPYIEKHGEIPLAIWRQIKQKGALKDKKFSITIEYAMDLFQKQKGICALSGQEIGFHTTPRYTKRGWRDSRWIHTASLDRIDSTKGYIEGNVQWIHKDINWMKNRFSQDYFVETCIKISNYIGQKNA